jgi:hypothetical protein
MNDARQSSRPDCFHRVLMRKSSTGELTLKEQSLSRRTRAQRISELKVYPASETNPWQMKGT